MRKHTNNVASGFRRFASRLIPATKSDVKKATDKIMEQIQTFANRVKQDFGRLSASVDGIVADVQSLKTKIEELQNSPGTLTPEDQAALDAIEVQVKTLADKAAALDEATAPAVTPAPVA